MDDVFKALGKRCRRRMLDIIKAQPGVGVGTVAREFDVSRIAVMKHLAILEKANLLISEKDGRMRRLYFNVAPIQMIHERWTTEYSAYWAGQLTDIKQRAEMRANKKESKPS